jgi:hypothetical protein
MPASVRVCPLPSRALLAAYRDAGHYSDCYAAHVAGRPSLAAYVEAFYTSWLFRLERMALALAALPSTDEEASVLARGGRDRFAAWRVEGRERDQLLLCDVHGRTRSWLMAADAGDGTGRTLYFGSAVVSSPGAAAGVAGLEFRYRALLGFHRVYSRALLRAAVARLERRRPTTMVGT